MAARNATSAECRWNQLVGAAILAQLFPRGNGLTAIRVRASRRRGRRRRLVDERNRRGVCSGVWRDCGHGADDEFWRFAESGAILKARKRFVNSTKFHEADEHRAEGHSLFALA
jgi:hypothetical protein